MSAVVDIEGSSAASEAPPGSESSSILGRVGRDAQTEQKLQLSLDELIQQQHVPATEKHHQTRHRPYRRMEDDQSAGGDSGPSRYRPSLRRPRREPNAFGHPYHPSSLSRRTSHFQRGGPLESSISADHPGVVQCAAAVQRAAAAAAAATVAGANCNGIIDVKALISATASAAAAATAAQLGKPHQRSTTARGGGSQLTNKVPIDPVVAAERSALAETELIYPSSKDEESNDFSLIVRFKGTDVLKIRKSHGDMVLSSGGWRTLSTRIILNNALKPLGLWIEEVPSTTAATKNEGSEDAPMVPDVKEWRVLDGKSYLATFQDGMIVGNVGRTTRAQLLARASVVYQHLRQIKSNANRSR